jgi:hypothetical protein
MPAIPRALNGSNVAAVDIMKNNEFLPALNFFRADLDLTLLSHSQSVIAIHSKP